MLLGSLTSRSWRVWIISERRNWWLPSFMLLLELAAFALALYLAYWGTTVTLLTEFARINVRSFDFGPSSVLRADSVARAERHVRVALGESRLRPAHHVRPPILERSLPARGKTDRHPLSRFGTVYYLLIRPRRIAGNTPVSSLSSPIGRLVVKTFQTNAASLAVQVLVLVRARLPRSGRSQR